MENIGSIIRRVLKQSGKEFLYYEGILKNRWRDIVGDFIADNTVPDRIYNNILYIKCYNSSLKQELFFLKRKIIEKVNKVLTNDLLIEDIKLFYKSG